MNENRKLRWVSGGHYNLEQCETEEALSEKLDEVVSGLSEQLGDVMYKTDDGKSLNSVSSPSELTLLEHDYEP